MTHPFTPFSIALLCLCTLGPASAAPPVLPAGPATPQATLPAPKTLPVLPGNFKAFEAVKTEVDAGKPLVFKFAGTGHCTVKVNGGDGYVKDFEGELPFSAPYTYGTGSMSSSDAFKDYTATAAPAGNCKSAGALASIKVRVNNPAPQSAGTPGTQNPVIAAAPNAKLTLSVKPPVATPLPSALTSVAMAFLPQAGGPTMLTINGTGACKFRVSHVMQEAPMAAQPMVTYSSASPNPFSMTLKMIDATPAGHYTWTASGIEGCTGSADVTMAVQ